MSFRQPVAYSLIQGASLASAYIRHAVTMRLPRLVPPVGNHRVRIKARRGHLPVGTQRRRAYIPPNVYGNTEWVRATYVGRRTDIDLAFVLFILLLSTTNLR